MAEKKKYQAEILLIQDDPFLSDIYKTKFEMEGFKTVVAESGEAGLEMLKKKNPDIILLDLLLPKMDGFAVLKEIKERKRTHAIPVVLLTSLGQKEDVEKGFTLGAREYLLKTHFKPSEILNTIKKILHLT